MPGADRSEHTDRIVICGAGPTGLCLALTLAQAGVASIVLEKGVDLATESRASTFHPPTLELLADLGVADAIVAAGLRAPTTQFRDRRHGPVATFDLGVLSDDTPFPFRVQLEQDKASRLVLDEIERNHARLVDVRFEHRAHAVVSQSSGSVAVLVGTRLGYHEITAPWVVAADGAHSAIRTSLGIDLVGETYAEQFLVVSVRDELADHLADLSFVNYVADPDEWLVLLRTPDHWRVLFPIPGEDPQRALRPEEVQRRLDAVVALGRPWDVIASSLYVVSRRVAERMRDGRILLAGDAAHQNSPLGGMGMNSGIQDAVSCGRRLARVIAGESDAILDEYDVNRRRVATEFVQADAHANWLVLRETDDVRRAELQAELRAIRADPVRHRERMARTAMLDAVRNSL